MPYTDPQIERIGTACLLRLLYRENIKAAFPDIDDGVDIIAYIDREPGGFDATPLQLKCYREFGFLTDTKYMHIKGLKIAYIWHVDDHLKRRIFLMDYHQAEEIVNVNKWTRKNGRFVYTNYTTVLEKALAPYERPSLRPALFPSS